MATLLGGINKQAVAPAMNNMAASLDQQWNDPNAYYNMPDENLLLHTNRAYDMADRGQIARSEVPVVGLLNSNMNDTATREQALGMDIMNRRRFATPQNKVEQLKPEQFTKTLGDEATQTQAGAQAPLLGGTPAQTQATAASAQATAASAQAPLLGGATMTQGDPNVGQTYVNQEIPTGMQPREVGYNEQTYQTPVLDNDGKKLGTRDTYSNSLEAEAMARSLGWDRKSNTTTEKRINEETGDTEERTIVNQPYLQAGYDEGMGVNTSRVGVKPVTSDWKVIKKAPEKKSSGKVTSTYTWKPNFEVGNYSSDLSDTIFNLAKIDKTASNSASIASKFDEIDRLNTLATKAEKDDDDELRNKYKADINEIYTELKTMSPQFDNINIEDIYRRGKSETLKQYKDNTVYGTAGNVKIKSDGIVNVGARYGDSDVSAGGGLKYEQGRDLDNNLYFRIPLKLNGSNTPELTWVPESEVTKRTPATIAKNITQSGSAFGATKSDTFVQQLGTKTNKSIKDVAKRTVDPKLNQLSAYAKFDETAKFDKEEMDEYLTEKAKNMDIDTSTEVFKEFLKNPKSYFVNKLGSNMNEEYNKRADDINMTISKYSNATPINIKETFGKKTESTNTAYKLKPNGKGAMLYLVNGDKEIKMGPIDGSNLTDEKVMKASIDKIIKNKKPNVKSVNYKTEIIR